MVYWIRKIAAIFGGMVFFVLFFVGLAGSGEYTLVALGHALLRAIFGASLAWFVGIIISDILLKAILADTIEDRSALVEGGLMQRIQSLEESMRPGGADMPFSRVIPVGSSDAIKTKR